MSNDEAVLSRMSEVLSIELKKHSHEYRQELLHRLAFIGLRTLQNEVHHNPLHIEDILTASNRLVDTSGGSGELRKELLSIKEQLSKLTNRFEILSSEKKAEHSTDVTLISSITTTSKKTLPKSTLPFPPSTKLAVHSTSIQPAISTSQVSKDTRQQQEINDDQHSMSSNRQSYTSKPSSAWRSGDRSTSLSSQHGHKNHDGEAKRSNSEESPFMASRASDSQESTKQLKNLKSHFQGGSNEIAAKVTQMNPLEYKPDTSLPSAPIRHHLDDRGIKDVLRPVKNPWEWPSNQNQSDTPAASSYGSQASSTGMHPDHNNNNTNSNMLHQAQSQYLVQQLANHIHQFQSLPIEQETLGVQDYVSLGNPQQFTQIANNTGSSNNINNTSNTVSTLGNGNYASPKFRENTMFNNNTDKKNTQQPTTAGNSAPVGLPPTKKGQQSVRRLSNTNKNNNETSSTSSKVATTRSQQKREELSLRRKTNGNSSSSKKKLETLPAQPTYLKNVTSRIRQEIQNDKELSKRQSANHEVMFFVKDPHVKHSTHTFSGSQIEQQQYILESQNQQQKLLIQQQQQQFQQQQLQQQQQIQQQQNEQSQQQPSLQQQYRQQSQFELRSYPQSRQYIDSQQNPGFQYDYQHDDENDYSSQLQPHSNFNTNPQNNNTNTNFRRYSQPSQQDLIQNRDNNTDDDSYQMHLNNINDNIHNNQEEEDHLDIPAVPDLEDDSYADFSAPDQRYVWNPPSTEHLSKLNDNQLTHETDTMMGRDHFRSESQLQPSQQQRLPSYAHLDSRSRFDVLHSDENFNHLNYPDQSYNNNSFYSSSQNKGDSDHTQVNITSNSQNIMSIANNFLQSPLMSQLRGKDSSTIMADNSTHSKKRIFNQQQSQDINGRIIPKHMNNSSSSNNAGGISDQFNESYLNASSIHHSRSYKQHQDQDQGSIIHDNYEKQNSSLSSSFAPFEPDQDMKVFLQKEGLFNRIFEAEDINTSEKKFDNTFISNSNNHQNNNNDGAHQITSAKSFRRQIPDFSTNAYSNNGSHNDREDMSLNMGDSSNSSTNQQAHPRYSPIVVASQQQRNGEYINTSTSGRKEMLEIEGTTNKNINGINSALMMEGRLSNFFANKK